MSSKNIDQAQSYLAALHPSRVENDDVWMQVGKALHSVSETLLPAWEQWSQQSNKDRSNECKLKWQSFKKSSVTLETLERLAKQDGWQPPLETQPTSSRSFPSNVVSSHNVYENDRYRDNLLNSTLTSSLDLDHIQKHMRSMSEQDLPASAIKAFKLQVRLDNPELTAQDIEELWVMIVREQEQAEANKELLHHNLPNLLQVKRQRLLLSDYLWGDGGRLATQLTATATAMPTAPEFLLTTLIAAAGSRIGAGTQISIKPSAGYTQPAIYRTLIVAATGCKKTPAQKIILSPLETFEAEAFEQWQKSQTDYQVAVRSYSARLKRGEDSGVYPPSPPPRKRYIVSDSTIEARGRIHQENLRGFLIYRDEGSAHFTSRNKHRKGSGDDLETELTEFNGGNLNKDRKFESLFVTHSAISRTGSIQWDVLANLMKNHDDSTGEWSRWLFCAAPVPVPKIDLFVSDADADLGLCTSLKKLYQRLDQIEPQLYQLSLEAKVVFQTAQHRLIDWMQEENQPGLKAAYPKFESYLARVALWLHLINSALKGCSPAPMIDKRTMVQASQLTEYFVGQLRLIYAHNAPQQQLAGILLRMQTFAEGKGRSVELREFKSGIWGLRKCSTAEIKTHLATLVQTGYGVWVDGKYQPSKDFQP